jgi:hypothetical protein
MINGMRRTIILARYPKGGVKNRNWRKGSCKRETKFSFAVDGRPRLET